MNILTKLNTLTVLVDTEKIVELNIQFGFRPLRPNSTFVHEWVLRCLMNTKQQIFFKEHGLLKKNFYHHEGLSFQEAVTVAYDELLKENIIQSLQTPHPIHHEQEILMLIDKLETHIKQLDKQQIPSSSFCLVYRLGTYRIHNPHWEINIVGPLNPSYQTYSCAQTGTELREVLIKGWQEFEIFLKGIKLN